MPKSVNCDNSCELLKSYRKTLANIIINDISPRLKTGVSMPDSDLVATLVIGKVENILTHQQVKKVLDIIMKPNVESH